MCSLHQRGVIFSFAPRASISGNLLALSNFYWPRANGPVLVSIPRNGVAILSGFHDIPQYQACRGE